MRTSSAVATLNSDDTDADDSARSICESSDTDSLVRPRHLLERQAARLAQLADVAADGLVQLVLVAQHEALLLRDALDDLAELVDARTAC